MVGRERVKSFSANNNPSCAVAQVAPLRPFPIPLPPWCVTHIYSHTHIAIPIHTPSIIMAYSSVPACLPVCLPNHLYLVLFVYPIVGQLKAIPTFQRHFLTLRHIYTLRGSDYGNLFNVEITYRYERNYNKGQGERD